MKALGILMPYAQLIALKDNYKIDIHLYEEVGMNDINRILTLGAGVNDVIWAHSYSYADAVKAVSANFPSKYFLAEDLWLRPDYFTPNVVAIGQTPHEAYYLCGALVAKMSNSKKLGYVHNIEEPFIHRGPTCTSRGRKILILGNSN